MTKLAITAALLGATVLSAALSDAKAETRDYFRSGSWTNYKGTLRNGDPVCGMYVGIVGRTDKAVHVKFHTSGNLVVDLFKTSWRIPQDTTVNMQIGFDGAPWSKPFQTIAGMASASLGFVTIKIADDSVLDFFDNFQEANKMDLVFGGNEGRWEVDMVGSREAATVLKTCFLEMKRPTQPYTSQKKPTQPFDGNGNKPVRTQPYSATDRGA